MGNKNSKSVLEHSKINREIVDCIEKMQSINLFAKDVLSEDQEYSLLKEAKSEGESIKKDKITLILLLANFGVMDAIMPPPTAVNEVDVNVTCKPSTFVCVPTCTIEPLGI